ncbi:PREDICTED: microtubule-associated protein futsch [Trachymyrmex cornetzi]|uniref:microtubule-associated protein futsch n=1 Tax=Trachymyrmex cornetzi TaxID=471704 RepID=UPI00084F63AC|nr:PREDICTED: microtubule-associated protein futsch [Trachymyrmex cornetzi]
MSTTDPTGEGGGGGGGESATTTNVEQTPSPSTPITGTSVPMQATTQQQQQPQQHPPPSPLSGCYLLVVLPEPHTAQHKDLILNRLAKGFLSWDKDSCHVDLEKELLALVAQAPEGEEARNGERLIQYATENLVTEVLIHPQTNTLLQCIRNLLASFTKHRHIIHAGYTFGGNGSWILQDGTFSLADFLDAFSEHEVQRVLRAYENSVTVDIHCAGVGDWTTSRLSKEACCRSCRVRVNPDDVLTAGVPAIMSFTNYIGQYLVSQTLDQLMEPSDVVGNIRFSHPTLYVFPGGQGDAALFGINGFNMLVDGGFARKACFWDFTRHLDRLDAVLVTRINNSNIGGMFSVLRKKKEMHVYPQIGHFFCNLIERRQSNSPDGDKDIDPLIFNLTDIGQEMVVNLRHVNLRAHPCYRDPDPINLYHKVGHGTLDMYVLSPSKDSREVREFLAKWHTSDSKLFAGSHKKDSNNLTFPIQNLVSICALLVWQPANPEDNITRILFPGSTPQHKIFEGFERLKHLDFLKHPVCSAKTLSPSVSLATLRDKPTKQKLSLIEKEPKKIFEPKKEKREPSEPKSIKAADETVPKSISQSTPIIAASKPKIEMKTKKVVENKKIETEAKESKKIEKELKEVKKEPKKEPIKVEKPEKREDDVKKTDLIKPESEKIKEPKEPKEPKPKPEPKKKEPKESKVKVELKKSELTPKPKLIEKKAKPSGVEKRDAMKSSPTTPKKTLNGAATKTEISKAVPKVKPAVKVAPSLPAKSAKEANNRKVVEQKKSEVEKSAVKDSAAPVVKVTAKPKPMDRKPISRRTKPVSPNKARMPGSPAKSTRSTPTASVKSDKDGVIRKVKGDKGTTDSSTVSTPSGIEPEVVKPIDKSLIEQSEDISLDSIESKVLADLKEEREVVEEIEAVLQKAERIEEIRKDDRFEGDDEITAEATDKKEEDITEEDVTAEIEDVPKKEGSRKESQELTEEDEYLIVEKEEVYTEDSAQSGEGEQKHVLDEAQSEKAKVLKDVEAMKEKGEKEEPEEKGKDDSPEKKVEKILDKGEKEIAELSSEHKEQLQEEVKEIIASAAEIVQKAEEKDDSGKKDSEDITKEPSSLSPDKLDSSEKKTTDTDIKPDVDQKENILEKMEESQERISTIESGATTTAPTLPEDERIPLDEIKEDIDEKHVIEEVKEKDAPAKLKKEVIPETVLAAAKPEVKVFDVRQAIPNLQRDIVKTPDEVADLPVHEEVDPKLYRMEDFEKGKEEKLSPTAQEDKESSTPPAKEQKGVFSFFGKVADKFEKGIDKLTKKKKDSEKDSDEKSSSKSSSPKEPKVQEKTVLEEVDMEKVFPKIGKPVDKPETFEEAKPTTVDVKVAAIKETAAFIQEEILDIQRKSVPDIEEKLPTDKLDEIKKVEAKIEESFLAKDVSPGVVSPTKLIEDKEIAKEIELLKEEDIGEDVEEVKALLEEASKKFKTVKDSLRDSLESLEDKIKEEIAEIHETPSALKDMVKDTLEGVAEKLEEIKPHIESHLPDIKEPEKVKFAIPKDEEFEEEYEEEIQGPYRDMKEAVRDVGEVLAGTAGIELEDKPKDVIEIVKKVAEVLREDDFLSDKTLFEQAPKKEEISPISTDRKPSKEEISPILTEKKPSIPSEKISPEKVAKLEEEELKLAHEDIVIPKKVDVTEVFPVHEEFEKFGKADKLPYEKPDALEVKEEPCIKVVKEKDDIITSPIKDVAKDKRDAQKICEEILKDDQHICDQHKKPMDDDTSRVDVMQAGIEDVCVKEVAKRPSFEKKLEDEIEESVIGFEQKISPAKAEIVMVTPGSTPTSPKFVTDKIYDEGLEIGYRELPEDIKQILSKEVPVEEIIEELIITKKKKVTIEVIEYITVTKHIPRERVIYVIEEIITKKGLPRESVIDDPEILRLKESITLEKRMEIEEYILNEYIVKGKRITIEIVQEISIKKVVPKKIVIEIIEEIIVKRKLARHMILNVPEEVLSEIIKEKSPEESPEQSAEEQITEEQQIDITAKQKFAAEVPDAPTGEEKLTDEGVFKSYIEEFIVNEYVTKGKKITASTIDDISIQKTVPKQILIEIIEEIIIKRKIPKNTVLDVTEEELLAISKKTPEDEKEKLVAETPSVPEIPEKESITSQKRAEIEEYIINEYITKGDNINIKKLEEICGKKKVPKRIIIEIVEEIIIKRKIPRHTVLSVTDEELSHIIKEEAIPESQVLTEKPVAEVPSTEEKKSPIELKKDKKEDVLEQEMSAEEELSATSEEEDVEKEVDGFVSIPRRISDTADIKKKAISEIPSSVTKEHEKDVIDDFEAVEQEYKVRDVQSPEKASEMKEKEDIEESMEDTTSEVIEADEKFVQETKGKVGIEELQIAKDIKPTDEKREPVEREISEISEIVDTTEKYLDEAKEKTDDMLQKETATTLTPSISDKAEKSSIEDSSKETPKDFSDKRPSIDAPDISKSITPSPKIIDEKLEMQEIEPAVKEEVEELQLKKVVEGVKVETKLADATGFTQEPKVELLEDDKKFKPLETTEIKEAPITKEEKGPQETLAANIPKPFDDGTVKRMLVTACSEDGREETEICPSGSITFTKTVTPDDSLKDVSAKSTPDKDSLLLDKDSRSDISTPEKDSISEKSAPEGKDKITPEDSLEKSPGGPRDSQDLEDSLEKSELRKPKVPEELEDIIKSPVEKDLEISDKIAEKDIPKSPKEEQVEPKSSAEEKIKKPSSPVEKIEKSRSPSPLDTTTQKSPIELAEKPKLPIEKVLPEPKKEGTIGVPKTPESFHSEDVSPAETIFSKSPTDKSEMYFAKAPITEEDVAIEKDIKKLPESIKEIKSAVDKELPISLEKSEQDIKSLDKSPSILSDKVDEKETDKLKSPSIMEKETVSEKLPIFESEHYDEKGPIDEARSPSAISDKSDEKKEAERSKSPSIAADKPDLQDVTERYLEKPKSPIFDRPDSPKAIDKTEESHDKDRSPSVASDKSDSKKVSDRSRSPSVSVEKVDFERTRSPSVTSAKDDKLEQFPVAKSPEIPKDVLKSPKLEEDKSDLKDIMQSPLDKSRSPSVTSGISESKEPDRSKSPSIAGEKPDMKDVTETPMEKSRSPSVISITSEQKEPVDRSKSPSIAGEKIDLKDIAEPADRSKSPSVTGEKPDLKDVTAEKSRSSSITGEQKESLDRSKSPSVAGEKPDLKDIIELSDEKSKSVVAMSATTDSKGLDDRSKSPSSTDLTDITEQSSLDKSKSPSVTSITSDQKESVEKAKSPISDKKEERDRSKSPSIISEKSDEKKSADGSKATSVTEEKPDLKDVMEPPADKSRSSSVTSEKAELFEKSTSPVSDKLEPPVDRSKSPSVASDKSDEKTSDDKSSVKEHYESAGDKSPSFVDVKIPHEKAMEEKPSTVSGKMDVKPDDIISHDRPVSPSIVFDKPVDDTKQPIEKIDVDGLKTSGIIGDSDFVDKTRSLSIISDKTEPKSPSDVSKSPSLADDQKDKSRSSSVASERLDDIKVPQIPEAKGERLISSSSADDQKDKSRSSSVASERLDDIKVPQIPEAKGERLISSSSADDQKDKSRSSSVASERLDDIKVSQIPEAKGERLISPSSADDQKDKSRSSSVASERLDDIKVSQIPEAKGERLISPSSADDQKDKSRSSSVASERLDDIKVSQIPEAKKERSISPSLDIGKIPKDGSAKSSRASSPVDKTPKDRSRSQSVFDAGEKTPVRSRTASLFDDKLSEKPFPQEEKHFDMGKPLDEKNECKKDSKSPITSPETIEKKMQKIREKRFADFKEPDVGQPSKVEKSDDEEEDVIKVTAEKKAEIEKYILDEYIVRKRKISLTVIERLVMTYSVPQFIVMEIIEDIINRQNMPRSAVFDFVDDEAFSEPQYGKESETELLAPQERAKVEEYIIEEFITKKKMITPEALEEMVIVKSVPRYILITIIEEIIVKKKIPRNTVIEGDLGEPGEKDLGIFEKREEPVMPASMDFGKITQEDIHSHEKSGDTTKGENLDGKISPAGSDRHDRDSKAALSASPSLSPEPIPSDKSTQDSPARSEPHIDEEILISEEKRMEIEKLLEEEYIKKGKKITEVTLEEIIIMTSLPRYIILEIVEEIILKRKIPRESVIDVEIYQEEEEDYDKAMYHYEGTTDVDYELPHDARGMYPESSEQQLDKSDYPPDYESQFHKAFVGGMTEMRTTHITTLSGKSTPEFTHDAASKIEPTGKVPEKLSESTLTTTHITRTDVEDTKAVQSAQTVTILRESKIAETVDKDKPEETAGISATVTSGDHAESDGDVIVSKTTIKHEVIKEEESGKTEVMKGIEPQETVKEIKQSSIQQDDPEAITKIIKKEIMEHDEPEVVTKVVKREIIEQDEPEIITKVIRREIVIPDEETSDSKEDSGEYMKTITTKTTRTIVTEELADAELAQADSSTIYTDPTSGSTYKVASDEGASDTASADIKRIVTTVTTITGPDGKVTTKTDVKESTDTLAGEELLEKLTESTKPAETIIKETITTVTSGTTTPDVKAFYSDSGKSTPDLKHEAKLESTIKERLDADKFEHPVSPLIRELISDDKSYSGKSSPDISLPKDIVFSGKSTPEVPTSPLIRDGAVVQPHVSGRSTPDKRSDCRSSTSTPEGFRSGEMIRTIVTTTKTVSDEGEIVTTTREVTETTNEKGETVVLAEKTDVKVDERLPSKDAAESAISSIIGSIKSSELQRGGSPDVAGSDDVTSEKDRDPASPLSEHSSTRSKVMTHPWGSSEERHTYSDDEPPSSSLSSTSQVGYSPQTTRRYESSSDKQEEQKQVEFSAAAMSSSFYGELPAVPPQISAMKTFHGETGMQKSSDPIHSRFTVEKEPAGDYGEKSDAKRYVDEADLDFDKALMDKEMKEAGGSFSSGIAPRYTNGSLRHEATDEKDHPSSSFRDDKDDSKGDSKKDPLEGWGTPLGLPSPKPPKKFNLKNSAQSPSCSSETTSDTLNFDVVKNWGEPLRLPSPAPVTNEISNKGAPSTPKKERKQAKKIQSENIKNKKRSESPGKNEKKMKDSKNKVQPVYMDLAYVPHHGNSYYTSLEFFKRVRARYYVFSGTEPSREVYDALLEAKKTWEDKDLEVTMIPTYDTDTLGYWVADNEEALAANHIDLSPSASRCTINLQDHETSCSAYRSNKALSVAVLKSQLREKRLADVL